MISEVRRALAIPIVAKCVKPSKDKSSGSDDSHDRDPGHGGGNSSRTTQYWALDEGARPMLRNAQDQVCQTRNDVGLALLFADDTVCLADIRDARERQYIR